GNAGVAKGAGAAVAARAESETTGLAIAVVAVGGRRGHGKSRDLVGGRAYHQLPGLFLAGLGGWAVGRAEPCPHTGLPTPPPLTSSIVVVSGVGPALCVY